MIIFFFLVEWLKKINLGGKWIFIGRIKMFLGLYLIWERVFVILEVWVFGVIEILIWNNVLRLLLFEK